MSMIVEAQTLRPQDLFALEAEPDGCHVVMTAAVLPILVHHD